MGAAGVTAGAGTEAAPKEWPLDSSRRKHYNILRTQCPLEKWEKVVSNNRKKIRIISISTADARFSPDVLETLVGLEFDCVEAPGVVMPCAGGSGAAMPPVTGYHVEQVALIAAVRKHNIEAGLWLSERYPSPDGVFTFYLEQVEVL